MKKIASILLILVMCGPFLPAVLSYEQKKVVLFATVEEERPDHLKENKGKQETKALFGYQNCPTACNPAPCTFADLFILFADDPCISNHTPPPDSRC